MATETREEKVGRRPCLDDMIEHLQTMRELHGNIVVYPSHDDVQAPGDGYVVTEFFTNWPDV